MSLRADFSHSYRSELAVSNWLFSSRLAPPEQNMWEGVPVVYTDGACSSNGRAGAAAGIGVYWGEQHVDNISEPLSNGTPTNNRAELTAVIRAIQTVTALLKFEF